MYISEFWVGFMCCLVSEFLFVLGAAAINSLRKGDSPKEDTQEDEEDKS